MTSAGSALTVVLVWPDLLGTYGDRGNAAALVHRARARGLDCRVVEVTVHDRIPRPGDIYLIGGGEDAALLLAWSTSSPSGGSRTRSRPAPSASGSAPASSC